MSTTKPKKKRASRRSKKGAEKQEVTPKEEAPAESEGSEVTEVVSEVLTPASEPKPEPAPAPKPAPKPAPTQPTPQRIKLHDAARRMVQGWKDHWYPGLKKYADKQGYQEMLTEAEARRCLQGWGAKLK